MGASSSWLKKNSRSFWSHLTSTFFLYQSSSSTPFSSSNIVGGDMFGKFSELSPSSEPSWSPPLPPEPLPLGCGECGDSGSPVVSLESSRGGVGISTWGFCTGNGKFCGSCGFLSFFLQLCSPFSVLVLPTTTPCSEEVFHALV